MARRGCAGRGGEGWIPGNSFERLLPGSGLERSATLRDGSAGRTCSHTYAGTEATDSWRGIVHLVRVCERGEHRFAHLAAQRGDCRAVVVTGGHDGCCFDVRADGDGVRAAGMAGTDAPVVPAHNAAADRGIVVTRGI